MSPHRLAAQTMLWRALRTLVQSFAPMLPHLAEDVFRHAPVLFTHGSTYMHSDQSAKEFGSSIFHYGLQHPALYGEHAGRALSAEHAADISESFTMVAGAAHKLFISLRSLYSFSRFLYSRSRTPHSRPCKRCHRTRAQCRPRGISVRCCACCEGSSTVLFFCFTPWPCAASCVAVA